MSTAVHPITLEEFIARPDREDDRREELIEGELIVSPGARTDHSEIVELLREQLSAGLNQKGYVLRYDFSCVLGSHSMPGPDLVAVTRARWDQAVKAKDWLTGSPELVIEVSSPSNRKLLNKAGLYLDHGAEQVWIVYPKTRTVTVVTADATTEARIGETLEFHGVQVQVTSIFPGQGTES
jgi:Uma2 family endonuclease